MAITVTLDKPDYTDGVPLEVRGLGVLKNRVPMTLTEDQERDFARYNNETVSVALEGDEAFSMSGSALVTGDLVAVLGYDPADISDSIAASAPQGDKSPATSMGETEASDAEAEVAPEPAKVVTSLAPIAPPTPANNEGGDS